VARDARAAASGSTRGRSTAARSAIPAPAGSKPIGSGAGGMIGRAGRGESARRLVGESGDRGEGRASRALRVALAGATLDAALPREASEKRSLVSLWPTAIAVHASKNASFPPRDAARVRSRARPSRAASGSGAALGSAADGAG
jgi:hypothetical protein